MALQLTHELVVKMPEDTAGKQVLFDRPRDTAKVSLADVWDKSVDAPFSVAALGVELLSLGDVTSPAKGAYLEVDEDCDIRFNGSTDAFQIRRVAKQTLRSKLFVEADITQIEVTALANPVTGTYLIWGDEVP